MKWFQPVQGSLSSTNPYWVPNDIYKAKHHTGYDLTRPLGTAAYSAGDGVVVQVGYSKDDYGNYIKIKHANGLYTFYAHLAESEVRVGMQVQGGQEIGKIGSTGTQSSGPHLHFEVRDGEGGYWDSVDPSQFFAGMSAPQGGLPDGAVSNTGDDSVDKEPAMTRYDFGNYSKEFLKRYPGVKKILDQAVKEQWSIARWETEFTQTKFYKERASAQREYDVLVTVDARSAQAKVAEARRALTRMARQMGVDDEHLDKYAERMVRNGLSIDDMLGMLAHRYEYSDDAAGRGGEAQRAMIDMAARYGLKVSERTISQGVKQALAGGTGWGEAIQGNEGQFREAAKRQYRSVADEIDKGATVADILSPYRQIAADSLGVSEESMKPWDTKWSVPISGDSLMTLQEWRQKLRDDPQYGWANGPEAMKVAQDIGQQMRAAFGAA